METFPTTTGHWVLDGLQNTRAVDPTQRAPIAAGYEQRSFPASFVPRLFKRVLRMLTDTEMATLEVFQMTVTFGASAFYWTDTHSSTVFEVTFDASCLPLAFQPDARNDRWMVPLAFKQSSPNELDVATYEKLFHGSMAMLEIINVAAGVDITDLPIFGTQKGTTFSKIGIMTKGTPAGIDDSNTAVLTLKNGAGQTIVTKTYNTANQPPTSTLADLGALSITELAAGDIMTLSMVQGTTANMPAFAIVPE